MKALILALVTMPVAVTLLSGCGGPGNAAAGSASGRAVFTVKWPAPSRLIPDASKSIKVEIRRGASVVGTETIVRPAGGGQGTATFASLPVDSLTATATAYPNPDGTGTPQASASVLIQTVSGQTSQINLIMQSTVTRVDLSPSPASVKVGQSLALAGAAKDAAGNVVLISPAKVSWTTSNPQVVGVDSTGHIQGNSAGTAQVTMKDQESGKSGTVNVEVTGGTGGGTTTSVRVSINWAARSRSLNGPASALSATMVLKAANPDGSDFSFTVNRDAAPAAYTGSYTSPNSAKSGTWVMDTRFYALADGQGSVVGTAGATVTINADGSGLGSVNTVGAVASVSVPSGQTVAVGKLVDLTFAAKDAQGTTLAITAGSAFWQVTGGQSCLKVTNGQLEGLGEGSATVAVSVDGKSSSTAPVKVQCLVPSSYSVTDLGNLGYDGTYALGINNGIVAAYSYRGPLQSEIAYLWRTGSGTDLGTLPGGSASSAAAVNSLGHAAGYSNDVALGDQSKLKPVIFKNGAVTQLPGLSNDWGMAYGINDSDQVVGNAAFIESTGTAQTRAVIWTNGAIREIGTFEGHTSFALGINNAGKVTGSASVTGPYDHAYIWQNGVMTDLGTISGGSSTGYAISDRDDIVGSVSGGGREHAMLYRNGTMSDLGTLLGTGDSRALAVNRRGQIVGFSMIQDMTRHAFLYCGGRMHDLNGLVPPGFNYILEEATGIDDAGRIVCVALSHRDASNTTRKSFLLIPNP